MEIMAVSCFCLKLYRFTCTVRVYHPKHTKQAKIGLSGNPEYLRMESQVSVLAL